MQGVYFASLIFATFLIYHSCAAPKEIQLEKDDVSEEGMLTFTYSF